MERYYFLRGGAFEPTTTSPSRVPTVRWLGQSPAVSTTMTAAAVTATTSAGMSSALAVPTVAAAPT